MANRYAVATGNWSNTATWDGGTLPADGDTVRPNGFTVTIDQNIGAVGAVTELRNDAGGGAVASGSFSITGAYTLYANITGGSTVAVCTFSNAAGVTVTLIGNIVGGSGFNGNNVVFSGGGTLNITGNITGGSAGSSAYGLAVTGTGTLNITGNILIAVGSAYGGSGLTVAANATVNITGNVSAGTGLTSQAPAVINTTNGQVTITGDVSGSTGTTASHGINASGNITVNGNVTAGSPTNCYGINQLGGILTLNCTTISASGSNPAVNSTSTGNTFLGSGVTTLTASASGTFPVIARNMIIPLTGTLTYTWRGNNSGAVGNARSLYTGGQNLGQPNAADVRYGTTFGVSNEYTGQIRIPPAGSVAFGVLVDNTTGTATLSHPGVLQQTTIATLASQTSFTLAAGSADNDAYNGMTIVVTDASTSTQKCVGTISDYVGSTRTVTLSSDPGIFTMAAGDSVAIIAGGSGGGGVVGTVDANLVSIGGDTQSATDLKDFADAGYDPSTNKVQGVVLVDTATDVTTKSGYSLSAGGIAAIWDAAVSGLTTVGSIGKRIVDYLTGDIFARLGAPAGASIAADIADLPTVAEFEARTLAAANYATAANLATVAGYLDTEIAAILADTNELQTDWADGGRLDLILDARASQTSVDAIDDLLDTEIAAIKSDTAAILLDTGTDGVVVAAGSKTGYSLAGTLTTLDALWAKIQKWLRLGFRKDAAVATDHATELSEINANGGSGAGAFANTTDSLEAIRDRGDAAWTTGGGGGSGSGAYTVTLTVTDDAAAAVQGAIVRISKTGEAYTATTNASGVATFSLDAATWTVAITAGGAYAFTPTTLVVSGDTSQTYSLTDNAPSPPAAPLLSTGYLDCYGTDGAAEEGVDIEIVLKTGPGTAGYGLDTGTATATSAANGRASHSGFVQGATYQARRGPAGSWVTFTVPNAGTFQLPETLGKP